MLPSCLWGWDGQCDLGEHFARADRVIALPGIRCLKVAHRGRARRSCTTAARGLEAVLDRVRSINVQVPQLQAGVLDLFNDPAQSLQLQSLGVSVEGEAALVAD